MGPVNPGLGAGVSLPISRTLQCCGTLVVTGQLQTITIPVLTGQAGTPIALQKRMNVVCADVYDLREDGARLSWIRV